MISFSLNTPVVYFSSRCAFKHDTLFTSPTPKCAISFNADHLSSSNSSTFSCPRDFFISVKQNRFNHKRFSNFLCSSLLEEFSVSTELPPGANEEDSKYMRRAVELSRKALGHTSPNPMVGCVIVKDGEIIGEGFHPKAGEPHAEVFALKQAGHSARGSTAYVSLEPCNHFGRTPPCSQALVRAKVKKVVIGAVDPNPQVGGKGIKTLRDSGIEVVVGVEEDLCKRNVEAFMFKIQNQMPMATLRYSMSMDGKTLGSSKTENVSPDSHYSKLLAENDVVVVTDASLYSNPKLLTMVEGAKQPLRIVLARSLDLPKDCSVFDTSKAKTLVLTESIAVVDDVQRSSRLGGPDAETWLRQKGVEVVAVNELSLDLVLDMANQRGANSVLWDSQGPRGSGLENYLAKLAMAEGCVQKVVAVISPEFSGADAPGISLSFDSNLGKLERVRTSACGSDVVIEGYFPPEV